MAEVPSPPAEQITLEPRPRRRLRWAVLIVTGLLLIAAVFVQIPYYAEGPGPARDVLPRIVFDGQQRYEPTGRLELTTVRYRPLTPALALVAWLDDTQTIVSRDVLYPPGVPTDVTDQRGVSQMDQSKIAATAVALRALDLYPDEHGTGALIEQTAESCPADGKLFPGDIITAIDGEPVTSASQASELFDTIPDDRPLRFTLDVDGTTERATFTRAPCGPDGEKLVGISMIDVFPFDVTYSSDDIGGPSAGLMWALGLYELLTPGDLTAGRTIAGTGQIGPDGRVYPIGGIEDKVVAAQRAGASLFLAPQANMPALRDVDTGDMEVVPVRTFDDALAALGAAVQAA
jgi:PDZ domain-containing protein